MRDKILVHYGKILEFSLWSINAANSNRIALNFPIRIGDTLCVIDLTTQQATEYDMVRADAQGNAGDLIPVGEALEFG